MGTDWVFKPLPLVIIALAAWFAMGIEKFAAEYVADKATRTAVSCSVGKEPIIEGTRVALKLDCNGRELVLEDAPVIVSYLKSPGPLNCDVSASGRFSCKERG